MKRSRQTRAQLEAEIQALLGKKEKLADDAAKVFSKALFTKDVKDVMMDLDDDQLKSMAKAVAAFIKSGDQKKLASGTGSAKKSPSKTETFMDFLRNENVDNALKDLDKDVIKVAAENITKSIGSIVTMAVNSAAKPAKAAAATSTQQTAGATKPVTPVSTRAVSGNSAGNVPESGDGGSAESRIY